MAGARIGALRVDLGLNSAQFIKGTQQAQSAMKGMSTKMAIAGAAITAAIGGAAFEFAKLARQSINVADEISKAAVKIGIGTEELSRLRYAADLSGVTFEQLQKGLLILNRNMAGIGGESGKVAAAFAQMGIETRNADGSLKSSTQVLKEMADVFKNMPDGAEKSALAMAVLGKSGADMIPLINGGSEALQQLTDEADKFGIVIDEETGRKAEEFNDNLTRLQGVFGALSTKIAAEMLPSLVDLTNTLVDNSGSVSSFTAELNKAVQGVNLLTRKVIESGKTFNDYFLPIVERTRNTLRGWGVTGFGGGGGNSTLDVVNALKRAAAASSPQIEELGNVSEATGSRIARIAPPALSASSSLRRMGQDADDTGRKLEGLMDRLFPAEAKARKLREEMGLLDGSGLSDERKASARFRLGTEGLGKATVSDGLLDAGVSEGARKVMSANDLIGKSLEELQGKAEVTTVRVADTFAQMAQNISSSLSGLAGAIRSGDFLGILSGVVGLIGNFVGGNGGGFKIPGFANGTNYAPGGLAVVGERGPELVNLGRGSQVIPNHKLGGGQVVVINNSTFADAYVDGRIASAAPAIAGAGAAMAQAQATKLAARRLR
jgi:hypothetical protein